MMSVFVLLCCIAPVSAFVVKNGAVDQTPSMRLAMSERDTSPVISRRGFAAGMGILSGSTLLLQSAFAIPMVTKDEFDIILRDSPLSIQIVEFSGPKSETITVRLVDGSAFGIKDIIESATDPRSPLKVSAACRESNVKTKFVDLEAILSSSPKKKKLYTNQRVQDAQEKEKAKKERMQRDEEERIEQLRQMEAAEAERAEKL
eukprot:CAMPEP_0116997984 /NCGR_PEP_ID=MMETSP0472-20121206/1222_1 /TAXON_ID=693140 ORGANISM="Tiarina fusus, Strain LIS" /NCGR_SAMPLE_ID=MMETSP0472 /ASSEMBLY_ACC=CAM_ASM_000603 /LENGTH=202 /DNA_ID=CAMNT_0004697015 /DNA_START=43 /DNA_END=651 /DNA_ORIENTATION=+